MHYLTGIIVKSYEELTNLEARDMAKDIMDEYEHIVWDWYENSPGRWKDLYGDDGVFRATSPEFHKIVSKLMEDQENHYRNAVENLPEISECRNIYESRVTSSPNETFALYELKSFIDCVCGMFTSNSHIFDGYLYTSRIDSEMLNSYREDPDLYYIVLFDVHN